MAFKSAAYVPCGIFVSSRNSVCESYSAGLLHDSEAWLDACSISLFVLLLQFVYSCTLIVNSCRCLVQLLQGKDLLREIFSK